ncbi:SDR family NAD(P)-dependent oxidoreductase [Fulvimonas yonginensis]|uniref:SDR family NAD(P)-dependent oxidoreductase n=1 Tax=Fulvimonas yonginensis TaxID=1495200 RepID=A0ABU8JCY7_9GAMM
MRVFITGSTDGLGRAAARTLLRQGHEVVLHARSGERASTLADLVPRAAGVAVGDLASRAQTWHIARQVNAIGTMDAIIHNAGVYARPGRDTTPEGHAGTLAVNTLAPYMLTALMARPRRLIYLSSGLHRQGEGPLDDIDWQERRWDPSRAYAESKLYVVALALFLARRWPGVISSAVDPGWVRTRMGGPGAPVGIDTGQRTQSWLAVSTDPEAHISGRYWHHMKPEPPAAQATDHAFQDALLARLRELTGVALP